MRQLKQIALAFDQLLNTFLGGMADETISARAWRNNRKSRKWSIAMKLIDKLFFWQKDHCYKSYLSEIKRKHLPPEYSQGD